ncbi:Monoacylglycerol lipase ABHD12 [Takifugu flavidus]|uniref:Monoacylglycerol lipase ABHD12 n=1 Tax=Takifugu flavidus TaxID=433684 RepID=A0A5C6PIA5_9TELE|nr:Monoacylglycerol lipase ABHD12 [Takifugu flavidus]
MELLAFAESVENTIQLWSPSWLKRGLFGLLVLFLAPVSIKFLLDLIQHFVYTHRVRVLFFNDLSQPADFSLNHTINMYLTSEEGISLGVWHTVPDRLWKEAQGKDLDWYQKSLTDGSPIFIYLHGNTGNRAAPHRVGVTKVLSALGYHVLVPDYRGFGDSAGEPTEPGLTTDALCIYHWVKAHSGNSLVIIWGHSLGTGVSTNTAVKLADQGVIFDGVILEGAFNSARQEIPVHPFIWPICLICLLQNVLGLCSDMDLTPFAVSSQLYEVALNAQNAERVKLVTFDGSLGYLHNGLYRDPKLPGILKNFVQSLQFLKNG